MWGITGRGARLGDGRRSARTLHESITRISIRGPVEHGVLEISGELDLSGAQDAVDVAASLPHRLVSIDLAGLDFIDIAGARAIEQICGQREQLHGDRPTLIGVTPTINSTLRFVRTRGGRLVTH